MQENKLKYQRAFQAISAPNTPPTKEFCAATLLVNHRISV